MNLSLPYLLNVALHAAILSVLASLLLACLRQARHRSVAAIAGLLAVALLPWLTALRPAPAKVETTALQTVIHAPVLPNWTVVRLPAEIRETPPSEIPAPPVSKTFTWPDPLKSIVVICAAGAAAGLLLLGVAWIRVGVWQKSLRPLDEASWEMLRTVMPNGPGRSVFLINETAASPCVSGFWRPRIVLPKFLFATQSTDGLRWAVRHEIAHHRAGDSRWMIVFAVIRSVNWWNPLTHRLVSQWADAREQLCDLHATGLAESRADYGEFLITMARGITRQPSLTVAMAKRRHTSRLKRRIVSLLGARAGAERPVGKGFVGMGLVGMVVCATIVSGVRINAEEPATESQTVPESAILGKQPAPESSEPLPTNPVQPNPSAPSPPSSRQVKITSKFILTSFKPGFTEKPTSDDGRFTIASLFSDQQMQLIMRTLARKRGTSLMTAPTVTAKPAHEAVIKSIREVRGSAEQIASRGPESEVPFVGALLKFNCHFSEELPPRKPLPDGAPELVPGANVIELAQTVDYRFVPGIEPSGLNAESAKGINPEKIKSIRRSINGRIPSGYTVCTDLGEIEPGQFLTLLTCVDAIDASGRLVKEADHQIPQNRKSIVVEDTDPSPDIRGMLRLTGTLVEIPLKGARPPGEGLVIGLTPSDPKVAAAIQKTPGAKVRKLKTVDMPLNQQGIPWPEFPGLKVSAIASEDFRRITVSSHTVGDGVGEFPNTWNDLSPGSILNFGIRTADPKFERRLLITIEAMK